MHSLTVPPSQQIVFMDSGLGGLPYLEWFREHAPTEELIYLADTEGFPYGPKTPEQITFAVRSAVRKLLANVSPKVVVVACNTASVVVLEDLRQQFSLPFVGVVPPIKPAAVLGKTIGILATKQTIEAPYVDDLVASFAPGRQIVRVAAPRLVQFVENRFFFAGDQETEEALSKPVAALQDQGVDCVVIGCSHFIHLERALKHLLGSHVSLVDSREGVGKQILSLSGRSSPKKKPPSSSFFVTAVHTAQEEHHRRAAARFSLTYQGLLA